MLNQEYRTLHLSWIHSSILIPASVIIILRKILKRERTRYTNPTHYTNQVMNRFYEVEQMIYKTLNYLPFGTSIAAVALKEKL
ncbi:MAG: hypothetical protein HYW85_01835 [Deltaproteobacteria bacterium]|nr:hypothetical protein [Deltaproteobacteria bacterium]